MSNTSSPLDLLIIGAGLTGLTLAYRLRNAGLRIRIFEARNRIGGRIHTTTPTTEVPPQEMGATWLHTLHEKLISLLEELNLNQFEQVMGPYAIYEQTAQTRAQLIQLPPTQAPSYRIQGGTSALIKALVDQLPSEWISLNMQVESLEDLGEYVKVKTSSQKAVSLSAKHVISTLPPYLFLNTIQHEGQLPSDLLSACAKTHTWMGESIKVSVAYRNPFWRKQSGSILGKPNTAGTIFSNVGPITEFYDHAPVEDDTYALMGFMNGDLYALSKDDRQRLVLAQLVKFYGPQAADMLAYNERVWRNEPFTYAPYAHGLVPHQNNGHPIFRKGYWDNKLFIGGSETASTHPGYMEGAVASGSWLAEQFKDA